FSYLNSTSSSSSLSSSTSIFISKFCTRKTLLRTMEFIFECFYEDTLDKLCRNGLQDRSSRRDVLDHLNAIIGGCSDGQDMHTEEVARIAVLAAVRYHREKKDQNGDVCLMGKFHNILYIALRTVGIGVLEIQQLLWYCL
ncbi:hypothetical protein DOY81_008496, partial [Sarcophaga bullata]